MLEFDSLEQQLIEAHNKQINNVIRYKLQELTLLSLQRGEYELYKILVVLNEANIDKVKQELLNNGYELELVYPKPRFEQEELTIKYTMDIDEIKLVVRKTIFEI